MRLPDAPPPFDDGWVVIPYLRPPDRPIAGPVGVHLGLLEMIFFGCGLLLFFRILSKRLSHA